MNAEELFLIIIFVLAVAGIIFCAIKLWVIPFHRCQIVKKTSSRLKKLEELNAQYSFDTDLPKIYTCTTYLNSKPKFDRYNLDMLFDERIMSGHLLNLSKQFKRNQQLYQKYTDKVKKIESLDTQEEIQNLRIPYDEYKEIEDSLFISLKLYPKITCEIVCVAKYSSPQGINNYKKERSYSLSQVQPRYLELQREIESQNSETMRRKRERSLMTDKLRYKILERDGFRCCLCGRSAKDGVTLHVDHIIPVSKGGRTVESNLRTLCDACNWGKGTEIEQSIEE